MRAQNVKAVNDLLSADKCVNLRESMRGPKELHVLEDGNWQYTFKAGQEETVVLPFKNLGMAILADCEHAKDKQAMAVLVALLRQPSFVPEATDFLSFVAVCRAKGTNLLLKTFVQSYQMQFLFSSYPYGIQRKITRLLLGLIPDGLHECWPVFDQSITLKRPYQIFVLLEMLENFGRISQARDIAYALLTHLTAQ